MIGHAGQQAEAQDHGKPDADATGIGALMLRQLVGQDGDEDQVVDAQHDFHDHQRHQRRPGVGIADEDQDFFQHRANIGQS